MIVQSILFEFKMAAKMAAADIYLYIYIHYIGCGRHRNTIPYKNCVVASSDNLLAIQLVSSSFPKFQNGGQDGSQNDQQINGFDMCAC